MELVLGAGSGQSKAGTRHQAPWMEHDLHASLELDRAHMTSVFNHQAGFKGLGPTNLWGA